jgi:hypothetical protein
MKSSEECYQAFLRVKQELHKYPLEKQTEADTRARLIDRILAEVLDWPPESILREEHAHPGFMDYVLLLNKRVAVLEAKKSGDTFQLPHDITSGKTFTVNGIISKVANLQQHINQVTHYCFNNGIEYAIVSNGLQYVIFRAVRIDGIHIGRGRVVIFNGVEDIEARFVEFWELLSKTSVESNSLQRAFQDGGGPSVQFGRVADQIHAYKEKVTRNRLSEDLEPLITEYMGEIADEASREKLKNLFVRSRELNAVLDAVGVRMSMSVSQTVRHTGRVIEPTTVRDLKAQIEEKVRRHVNIPKRGEVVLLLGRVGSGKTTFVTHFLQIDSADLFEKHLLVLLDFRLLERGGSVHKFFYEHLRVALAENEIFMKVSSKELRRIYAPEIRELTVGPLAVLQRQNAKRYEEKIADYLVERFNDSETHYPRVLRFLADKLSIRCFLLFDNVDQHDFTLQQEIFQFAHSFSGKCHAFSIVTMWEETYLRSNQTGGILSAYQNIAYRLPSTSVVDIISRRLEFVVSDIEHSGLARELIPNPDHAGDVAAFLWLVRKSVLNDERRARHFLESIALGNLRKAMELFSAFLVSGHTDTGKILNTYRNQHGYLIPLHEFIKSISLGDNRYYSSELSRVVNLFSISDESRPSHFTKARLLEYLFFHRNHSTTYGLGFISTESVRKEFVKFGTSDVDITESLRILSAYLLVENDVYERTATGNAYRITQAGRYYLRYLSNKFSYLDLVCQDTPISDHTVYDLIKELVSRSELEDRFTRVRAFVRYLVGEEEREHAAILNASDSMPLRVKLMPGLEKGFEHDHQYILQRRKRGRKAETEKTPYALKD